MTQDTAVGIATRWWAGWSVVQIPAGIWDFFLPNIQNGSKVSSWGLSGRVVNKWSYTPTPSACCVLWTGNTDLSNFSASFHHCSVFIHLSSNLIILAKCPRGLTFIGPCIVIYFYSKTNQMHQRIKFILFWNDTLHVSDGLSFRHQEFDICLLLYVQSWTLDDGRKTLPKHEDLFQHKINLRHWCIWLVLL